VPHPDAFEPRSDERVAEDIPTVVNGQGPGVRLCREGGERRRLAGARIEAKAVEAELREGIRRPRDDALIVDAEVPKHLQPEVEGGRLTVLVEHVGRLAGGVV